MKVSLLVSAICLSLFYFNTVFGQEGGGQGPLPPPRVFFEVREDLDDVFVTVRANQVTMPLFGAGFDIVYDNSVLDYQDYEKGTVFLSNSLYLVSQANNRITVGLSLKRGDSLVPVHNDDFFVSFHFKRRAQGFLHFRFADGVLATLDQDDRKTLSPVIWDEYHGNQLGTLGSLNLLRWNFSSEAVYFVVILLSSAALFGLGILSYGLYLRMHAVD